MSCASFQSFLTHTHCPHYTHCPHHTHCLHTDFPHPQTVPIHTLSHPDCPHTHCPHTDCPHPHSSLTVLHTYWPTLTDSSPTLLTLKAASDMPGLCQTSLTGLMTSAKTVPVPSLSPEPGCEGPVTPTLAQHPEGLASI